MKVSKNTIQRLVDFELPSTDELVQLINARLGGVEEVVELGAKYKDAVIVRVVSAEKHPDADRLHVCLIDDGGVTKEVPRNDEGYIQVVCGAPNVHTGMLAVWLPPNATVPATFDDETPFVLSARPLRGVLSQGMLAAGDELALNNDHDGIVEIQAADAPEGAVPGATFAEIFGLDDTIIDIENKMFTHRPDLFGQIGVAREIAGIFGHSFVTPSWYEHIPTFSSPDIVSVEVHNAAPELVPRLVTVALSQVQVGPSPLWLQCELVRLGSRPINNIVDITNYIMLMTAQPVHAYDLDTLRGNMLQSRMAQEGESLTLLNGKTYTLTAEDVVIADAEGPIGLAGIMGGAETEVSETTTRILLEVATFDMYAVRRTSMRHGLFTDALTRYNKGQSPLQNDRITSRLLTLLSDTGAVQASAVVDLRSFDEVVYDRQSLNEPLAVTTSFINDRLGVTFSSTVIADLLRQVNFTVESDDNTGTIVVSAPFWRTDIEYPEDIVEEVGRLYGYDRLPRQLPVRSVSPTPLNASRELGVKVRQALASAGANEVLTYSFVPGSTISHARQELDDAYQIANALSPELQYYRLSVTPSLLDKIHPNVKAGYDEFALFEIGRSHSKKAGLDQEGVPVEPGRIALSYASRDKRQADDAFYRVKHILNFVASTLGLELKYRAFPSDIALTAAMPFEPVRSARVIDRASGQAIGIVGEYRRAVKKAFKLPDTSAGFELFTEGILLAQKAATAQYVPLNRYPSVERDICFEVPLTVTYDALAEAVRRAIVDETELSINIQPLDIYHEEHSDHKRITLHFEIAANDRTLDGEATAAIVAQITAEAENALGATII